MKLGKTLKRALSCVLAAAMICVSGVMPTGLAAETDNPLIPSAKPQGSTIKVIDHNVYTGMTNFDQRSEGAVQLFEKYMPDSIGLQEANVSWMNALKEGLSDHYDCVGVGRENGTNDENSGEATPIFYLKDKYNLVDSGTFWLSETPDVPSIGWDAMYNRICTWAILENKETGETYAHVNTHFDHVGSTARIKSMRMIIDFLNTLDMPVVCTGDFNVSEGSDVYNLMLSSGFMQDTKNMAEKKVNEGGTMSNFGQNDVSGQLPIDFTFVSKDDFKVSLYQVLDEKSNGTYISDHLGIYSEMTLMAPADTYRAVYGTAQLDGQMDDAYSRAQEVPVNLDSSGDDAAGATGTARTIYDENYIYSFVQVKDSTPNVNVTDPTNSNYGVDGVQFFYDFKNVDGSAWTTDHSGYFITDLTSSGHWTSPDGTPGQDIARWAGGFSGFKGDTSKMDFRGVKTDDGYTMEIRVALPDTIRARYAAGEDNIQIGVGFQINDDQNDDGTRDTMCFDNPSLESAWKGPDYMSNMILAGSPESSTDPSVTEKYYYMAVPGTPTVDGHLDDAYLYAPTIAVNKDGNNAVSTNGAATSTARVLYDDNYIYVFNDIKDAAVNDPSTSQPEDNYTNYGIDNVQLFFDFANTDTPLDMADTYTYSSNDGTQKHESGYMMLYNNEKTPFLTYGFTDYKGDADKLTYKTQRTATGYTVELRLALSDSLKDKLADGQHPKIGIGFQVNDDTNDDGVRNNTTFSSNRLGDAWTSPIYFEDIVLGEMGDRPSENGDPSSLKNGELISTSATEWRYLDNNTDPAAGSDSRTSWTLASFDDSRWKTAKGSFGAKNGQQKDLGDGFYPNTLLNQYINGKDGDDIPAFFFRSTFEIEDLESLVALDGELLYDDAAIVYINGHKVASFYEPDGGFDSNLSYGGSNKSDPLTGTFTVTDKSLLNEGVNTIAVELHQGRASSSDIYFDFVSLKQRGDLDGTAQVKSVSLNVGGDETTRNVTWYSNSTKDGVVQLAEKADMTGDSFPETYQEFTATSQAANDSGFNSFFATVEVQPGKEYVYRVGNQQGWSEIYSFETQDISDGFNFLLAGDPQIGSSGNVGNDTTGWNNTLTQAVKQFPDTSFVLSAGDQVEHASNENEYAGFLSPEILKSLPLATNVGNHDVGSTSYNQHFNMPNVSSSLGVSGQVGGDYWFRYGNTLIMSINSNQLSTAQHVQFMEDVLKEQGDATWKVVTFHHSIYSTASHSTESDIIGRRNELAPEFSRLGIDVVLMGHDHVYTRSYMMDGVTPVVPEDGKPASSVTNPEDGQVLYITANSASGSKYYEILSNQAFPYAAVKEQGHTPSFSNIQVTDSSFTVTTYRSNDLSVIDTFTINKTTDTTAPVITLPEDNEIQVGDTFDAMEGVTATDDVDGDLTDAIQVEGEVDTQVAGSYDLIYRVSDKAGNEATATRTVVVKETVSIEASTDKQNYEVGETITLTVVTGSDVRAIGLRNEIGKGLGLTSIKSSNDGLQKVWTVQFSVGTKGDRTISIRTRTDSGWQDTGISFNIQVGIPPVSQAEPEIYRADIAADSAHVNEKFPVIVETSTSVIDVKVRNELGRAMGVQVVGYYDQGDRRIWTLNMEVGTAGSRLFSFYPVGRDGTMLNASVEDMITIVS
ncbi:Endo-1,4-beta-xylanase A precursor [Eubacteriaceae bacterium CHKCI005]|nr:Endo-1,4-beta-xylanase A precursor [Eubacteriaceae bacterium CHKCI005]